MAKSSVILAAVVLSGVAGAVGVVAGVRLRNAPAAAAPRAPAPAIAAGASSPGGIVIDGITAAAQSQGGMSWVIGYRCDRPTRTIHAYIWSMSEPFSATNPINLQYPYAGYASGAGAQSSPVDVAVDQVWNLLGVTHEQAPCG